MRILLISLPRCGSKFLQININSWLVAKNGHSLAHPNAPMIGFGELLHPDHAEQQGHLVERDGRLVLEPEGQDLLAELDHRISMFARSASVVAKIMPYQEPLEENEKRLRAMVASADRSYLLRRNVDDMRSSWLLSHRYGSWSPGIDQRRIIEDALANGSNTSNDAGIMSGIDHKIRVFNSIIERCGDLGITPIDFNNIIKLTGPADMCDLLGLPRAEFRWIGNMVEYGSLKAKLLNGASV